MNQQERRRTYTSCQGLVGCPFFQIAAPIMQILLQGQKTKMTSLHREQVSPENTWISIKCVTLRHKKFACKPQLAPTQLFYAYKAPLITSKFVDMSNNRYTPRESDDKLAAFTCLFYSIPLEYLFAKFPERPSNVLSSRRSMAQLLVSTGFLVCPSSTLELHWRSSVPTLPHSLSLAISHCPSYWPLAVVQPIPMAGSIKYRPISLPR